MKKKNEKTTMYDTYCCCGFWCCCFFFFFLFHFPLLSNNESSNNNTTTSQSTINNININIIERILYYWRWENFSRHYMRTLEKKHTPPNTRRKLLKHVKHNQCNVYLHLLWYSRDDAKLRCATYDDRANQFIKHTHTPILNSKRAVFRWKQLGYFDKLPPTTTNNNK